MARGETVYKVPGGKLIRIWVDFDGKINSIRITGDFFVYPETWIEQLEKELVNKKFDRQVIREVITTFATTHKATLFGITPESLCEAIMKCRR